MSYKLKVLTLLQKFVENGVFLLIGFEFEFYLIEERFCASVSIEESSEIHELFLKWQKLFQDLSFSGFLKKEENHLQFEVVSYPVIDPIIVYDSMIDILSEISVENRLSWIAKPFKNRPGNGMHINISLHNSKGENLYAEKNNGSNCEIKNRLMEISIAALLKDLRDNIQIYFPNDSIIDRVRFPDRNTPINISYGFNNRTTALRIPESVPANKRIEHRVASSENDFEQILYFILNAIYNSMFVNNEELTQKMTHGLAFDQQYNLIKFIDILKS